MTKYTETTAEVLAHIFEIDKRPSMNSIVEMIEFSIRVENYIKALGKIENMRSHFHKESGTTFHYYRFLTEDWKDIIRDAKR